MSKVYVFDPTASDKLSQVRGIGRYLQILQDNFSKEFVFASNLVSLKLNGKNSVFINPFFNFLQKPLTLRRIAPIQVAIIHDLIPLKYPTHFPSGIKGKINMFLNKTALKNYDQIITDSLASKKDIIDILGLSDNKIKVVYPCLPESFSKLKIEKLDLNKKSKLKIEKFCLYVGDATWNKNLVNLAKAIKIINVTCVFVGKVFEILRQAQDDKVVVSLTNPWQKELKDFIQLTKDDKRFIFTGHISDLELIKFYQQARLNVLPSRDEGFGFSYLEAATFGCPSVLSAVPVLKEISKGAASYADPKNPHEIADKIGEVYFNKELKNALGSKAYKRSKFFTPEKFKKDLLKAIS